MSRSVFGPVFRLSGGESVWAEVFILLPPILIPSQRVPLVGTSIKQNVIVGPSAERLLMAGSSAERLDLEGNSEYVHPLPGTPEKRISLKGTNT